MQRTTSSSPSLLAAREYAQRGWHVFPLSGETPLRVCGPDQATTDLARIERWWQQWPWANLAICTGRGSGLMAFDLAHAGQGKVALEHLQQQYGALPPTCILQQDERLCLLYRIPHARALPSSESGAEHPFAIRGERASLLAPPSRDPASRRPWCRWLTPPTAVADLPAAYLEALAHPVSSGPAVPASQVLRTALEAFHAGINAVPIPPTGCKHPVVQWEAYQREPVTPDLLADWFHDESMGIAFVTGPVSGNLELLDFDTRDIFAAWSQRLCEQGHVFLAERVTNGYLEETPNGVHLFYRCPAVERNQKLASHLIGPTQRKALIETRGTGGIGIAAPSCGGVHPSGRPYVLIRGGIATIQTLTQAERQVLFSVARSFDELPPVALRTSENRPSQMHTRLLDGGGVRPGDLYNQRASWREVLEPHGWELVHSTAEKDEWRRPGKRGPGISATTNFEGSDLLYVFSTSTLFEPEVGYSKFSAYALLNHGGDVRAAARELARQGYCRNITR